MFKWVPVDVYFPLYVHKLEIASQVTHPDITVANRIELKNLFNDTVNGYIFNCPGSAVIYYIGKFPVSGLINDLIKVEFKSE